MGYVTQGEKIKVIETGEEWVQVQYTESVNAYVAAEYVMIMPFRQNNTHKERNIKKERKIDITFNSKKDNTKATYQLASGYISQTTILFEKENIAAVIEAKGIIEFYNMNDELIATGNIHEVTSGRGLYQEVCCQFEDNMLKLQFQIYEWIDHYPNCDGEHDRWSTRNIGVYTLTLDLLTHSIQ